MHHVVLDALAGPGAHRPAEVWLIAHARPHREPARPGFPHPGTVEASRLPVTHTADAAGSPPAKRRALDPHATQAAATAEILRSHPETLTREGFHRLPEPGPVRG
ncbi:hypothetical protein ACN20G_36310 (plasmid) [Streptomyces sp. BI20]|uniref:hypothetical protein n=1 Tax=Streptomyces sp. BI20 TaxID=3403460 RepID=UPI003C78C79C